MMTYRTNAQYEWILNTYRIAKKSPLRDPLAIPEFVKKMPKDANFADEVEIKEMEKVIRKEVQAGSHAKSESPKPDLEQL
jgi:TPP-dependent pyruvate/acetoin dehydrogenase alpha subunit